MKQLANFLLQVIVLSSLPVLFNIGSAIAQDKVVGSKVVAPKKGEPVRMPVIENENVGVIEVTFRPGDISSSRARPGRVIHYHTAGQLLLTFPDGKTELRKFKAGETAWRNAETCEVKNTGKGPVRLLQVVPKSK